MPQATRCKPYQWYYFTNATHVNCRNEVGGFRDAHLWDGWLYVTEKKYHTDHTVTIYGYQYRTDRPETPVAIDDINNWTVLEMRRSLTVKTLKNGPPTYVIQEQTL